MSTDRHGSTGLIAAGREDPGGCVSFSLRRGAERRGEGASGGKQRPGRKGNAHFNPCGL